jgi:hypothetical protein
MNGTRYTATMKRLCGHTDAVEFKYRGRTEHMAQQAYARNTLCTECRAKVREMVAAAGKGFYRVEGILIRGTVNQVTWATKLRLEALRKHGPIMQHLDSLGDDPLARAGLAAYRMLFGITSAKYWIETREFGFSDYWLMSEIEHLMRSYELYGTNYSTSSAYGYCRQFAKPAIEKARSFMAEVQEIAQEASA